VSALGPLRDFLVDWLLRAAYPLWSQNGIDPATGGFVEALDWNGSALSCARRARVHPRQIYAFAQAPSLGWHGDVSGIINRGMSYFVRHYQRDDGFFLTLAGADGRALDGRALLYDQAFVLLGYAAAAVELDARSQWESRALELRELIDLHLGTGDGAYRPEMGADSYESNPHMHLLEAYLAWAEIGKNTGWTERVRSLVELAVCRFISKDSGALGEFYLTTLQPTPGVSGGSIEPGHQFEWAWLLLRCESWLHRPVREIALRLIEIGEQHGVMNGFAINALRDDFTVHDADARLWPQCERLKAALLAATSTGEQQHWTTAQAAAGSLCSYLHTRVPGLWFDVRSASGELRGEAVPASSFYHLVSAIVALDRAVGARQ
jgi:mannose/cellobiose epimerase-like protein (N-acyl-D-glucosamine 2-epimerase family)